MSEVLLYESLRTPRGAGKPGGALSNVPAATLLAGVLRELTQRSGLDSERIGEAIFGCVTQHGEQAGNVGKIATLEAGWSDAISVATVNHYCASSLWAFSVAAARVAAGDELVVAGGVESMSRVPMASDQPPFIVDRVAAQRLGAAPMGVSADAIATLHLVRLQRLPEEASKPHLEAGQKAFSVTYAAEPIFSKSNLIFSLVAADGLLKIPENATGLDAGEISESLVALKQKPIIIHPTLKD